jgi:hypothetical protein
MKLDDFVRETIVQIARGVHAAAEEVQEFGARVNPPVESGSGDKFIQDAGGLIGVQQVEFDVAVTVSSEATKGGKASIEVMSILSLGGGNTGASAHESQSRIKFSIPLTLHAAKRG